MTDSMAKPYFILLLASVVLAYTLHSPVSFAEKPEDTETESQRRESLLGTKVGVIEQLISLKFSPNTVFLLQETALGKIRQHQALAVDFEKSTGEHSETRQVLAGTLVPIQNESLRNDGFHFSFFIAGEISSFAATDVRLWTKDELKKNSLSAGDLKKEIFDIEKKLKKERIISAETRDNLALLRNRAAEIAKVDEIIALKLKAEALQREKENQAIEITRLKDLIELGRNLEEPEEANVYQKQLAVHLKEAAQVTAVADRLSRRKREAALQNFTAKVNLVKEMDSVQPEALAQEILRLRKKRRELENRMGITPADSYSDEF